MSMTSQDTTGKTEKSGGNRRKSRELALKGLYQRLLGGGEAAEIVKSLEDDPDCAKADHGYFESLLAGVTTRQESLDAELGKYLDRPAAELSPIEHAILYIAAYELIHDQTIPYRVVINEGVELAKRFGGTDGYKYVNGVLDKLAAGTRGSEVNRIRKPRQ